MAHLLSIVNLEPQPGSVGVDPRSLAFCDGQLFRPSSTRMLLMSRQEEDLVDCAWSLSRSRSLRRYLSSALTRSTTTPPLRSSRSYWRRRRALSRASSWIRHSVLVLETWVHPFSHTRCLTEPCSGLQMSKYGSGKRRSRLILSGSCTRLGYILHVRYLPCPKTTSIVFTTGYKQSQRRQSR